MLKLQFERDNLEFTGSIEDLRALAAIITRAAEQQQVKATEARVVNAESGKHLRLSFKQGKSEPAL